MNGNHLKTLIMCLQTSYLASHTHTLTPSLHYFYFKNVDCFYLFDEFTNDICF